MSNISRRQLLRNATACGAALGFNSSPISAIASTVASIADTGKDAMTPLTLGEIRPKGWLRSQLEIQATGMGGHLDEFWPDVGPNSGWLGGSGESWERGPYFIDGLLPLSVLLGSDALRAKAMRFIEWTLMHQQPNGMFGPRSNEDWWPRMVMLKVLMQYHQATGDQRVIDLMTRYFHYQLTALPQRPLSSWGRYRWQDEAMVVTWLYRQTGDPSFPKLFALLQQQGYDWIAEFRDFPYKVPQTRSMLKLDAGLNATAMQTHGVNNGQALKTAAVRFQMNGDPEEKNNFDRQLEQLYRYHGLPNGMFSCDEHLAGLNPSQGSELCTVVETMFSLEVALAAFGEPAMADRLEKIAFNALPGAFTDDMWAHQYDQQPNQVRVSLNSKPWMTDGPESNLFGLEPNFGCCTANFHQGWPKLTAHLWMRSAEDGLAAMIWAPCTIETKVRGARVQLTVDTDYPFRNTVDIHLDTDHPVLFPLQLRIPKWSRQTRVFVNDAEVKAGIAPESFLRLEREWAKGDRVHLVFEMTPFLTHGFNQSITVNRGPLVFSHSPGEFWVKLRDRPPTADWQVFGKKPWNYALAADDATIQDAAIIESPVGERPFTGHGTSVTISVPGRRLISWLDVDGVANPVPASPAETNQNAETLELIPYAAAKLRITAFPQCKD